MNLPDRSMPKISAETLAVVYDQVAVLGLNEAAIAQLRQSWPGIHFTLCSEEDVPARLKPELSGEDFDIYLVSGAGHCVAFTTQLEAATGLVLAGKSKDE